MDGCLLRAEAEAVGVRLEAAAAERLLAWCALVRTSPHNLTAIREPDQMRRKHLVDSLACLPVAAIAPGETVLDLGSGAGFPGIPIAVVHPEARVILVDSVGKKVEFLRTAVAHLGLANVSALQGRAEDLGRDPAWRGRVACVTARAVAPLRVLLELALPLCSDGGRLIALKGASAEDELAAAASALSKLGGKVTGHHAFALPGGEERRAVVRVDKVSATPEAFPRRAGLPQRRPL